jgi:hypothetical protein
VAHCRVSHLHYVDRRTHAGRLCEEVQVLERVLSGQGPHETVVALDDRLLIRKVAEALDDEILAPSSDFHVRREVVHVSTDSLKVDGGHRGDAGHFNVGDLCEVDRVSDAEPLSEWTTSHLDLILVDVEQFELKLGVRLFRGVFDSDVEVLTVVYLMV